MKERDDLKVALRQNETSKLANHPVVKNFQSIFHQFPHLYDVLSEESSTRHNHLEAFGDSNNHKSGNDRDTKPSKKRSSAGLNDTFVFQHQMFDQSVAQFIDTGILTSPSKGRRKIRGKNGEHSSLHDQVLLENVYRMFGITYFPVVDPTDLKVNSETKMTEINREMLGIRLEVFNEITSKYEKPYYILLKKKAKSDVWLLFKHTVPVFVDVEAIFDRINAEAIVSYEDVYLFIKVVYKQLVELTSRMQILEELMRSGVIEDLDLDLEAAAISFTKNEVHFRLLLQKDQVVSCSLSGDTVDVSVKPQLEALFLGPLHELNIKLKHLDQS